MYTYKYNHLGYTVYKDDKPVYKAGVLNNKKRYNRNDAENNKKSAEAHIKLLLAMRDQNELEKCEFCGEEYPADELENGCCARCSRAIKEHGG